MKTFNFRIFLVIASSTLLAACAVPNYAPATNQQSYQTSYGVIDSIQMSQATSGTNIGAGTIIGGVVGGLLGSQVGKGRGKTAAAVVGAVGGAIAGNVIEKNSRGAQSNQYQIGVRLDNGAYQTLVQDNISDLQVGTRVRIQDNIAYRY